MLTCECDYDYEPEFSAEYYGLNDPDFDTLKTYRRVRCVSCSSLIDIGAICLEHPRVRYPHNEIEAEITGIGVDLDGEPNIKISSHYHCEDCADIWLSLTDIGYCLNPASDMRHAIKDYHGLVDEAKRHKREE